MDVARFRKWVGILAYISVFSLLRNADTLGQGIAMNGVGPVNRSMGGAATAAPLDAMGTLYWNPAVIAAHADSELAVGLELLLPSEELASTVAAGALGPGIPPVPIAGATSAEPGVTPIPNVGFVKRSDDSFFSYGFGVLSVGGFSVNYPASTTNPILTSQAPNGIGLGQTSARAEILQLVPTVAVWLTDRLAVGVAPTVVMARVAVTPAFLAPPDDANGDGFPSFGPGTGARFQWGGGVQLGVYYDTPFDWSFGVSLKSPQWMEPFRFHSADELGRPVVRSFRFDYPTIISLGAAYSGWQDTVLAIDVRYLDYANANGFGESGFLPTGAIAGLGWDSAWSLGIGIQRRLGDRLVVRGGYWLGQNPIASDVSVFNVASPLTSQHAVSLGSSCQMGDCWQLHLTYLHIFESSVSGPLQSPLGPVPGTEVRSTVSADSLVAGVSVYF